jgi:hypothetical protein
MKTLNKLTFFMMVLGASLFMGCNAQREAATQNQVEQDLAEFRTWASTKFDRAEAATEDERAALKQEFNELTARVDRGIDNLTDEAKEEYNELKASYNEWEAEQERMASQSPDQNQQMDTALDPDRQKEWTSQLMGSSFEDISAVSAEQLDEAYVAFMENVRNKRSNWSDSEWAYAESVLNSLKERKDQLGASLSTEDRVKVEALEAEFGALRIGQNVKEEIKD